MLLDAGAKGVDRPHHVGGSTRRAGRRRENFPSHALTRTSQGEMGVGRGGDHGGFREMGHAALGFPCAGNSAGAAVSTVGSRETVRARQVARVGPGGVLPSVSLGKQGAPLWVLVERRLVTQVGPIRRCPGETRGPAGRCSLPVLWACARSHENGNVERAGLASRSRARKTRWGPWRGPVISWLRFGLRARACSASAATIGPGGVR